jgi:hypothetical protein
MINPSNSSTITQRDTPSTIMLIRHYQEMRDMELLLADLTCSLQAIRDQIL